MERCSFQITQKSLNTNTQNPEHSVSISIQDEALHLNMCPSALTSAIFLATDMLEHLMPPTAAGDSMTKSRSSVALSSKTKRKVVVDQSLAESPLIIKNEYGRAVKVWWKVETEHEVCLNI